MSVSTEGSTTSEPEEWNRLSDQFVTKRRDSSSDLTAFANHEFLTEYHPLLECRTFGLDSVEQMMEI